MANCHTFIESVSRDGADAAFVRLEPYEAMEARSQVRYSLPANDKPPAEPYGTRL